MLRRDSGVDTDDIYGNILYSSYRPRTLERPSCALI